MNKPRGCSGGKEYPVFSNMKHLEVLLLPPGAVSYPDVSLSLSMKIVRKTRGMIRKQLGDGMPVYPNLRIQEKRHTPDRLRNKLQYNQN